MASACPFCCRRTTFFLCADCIHVRIEKARHPPLHQHVQRLSERVQRRLSRLQGCREKLLRERRDALRQSVDRLKHTLHAKRNEANERSSRVVRLRTALEKRRRALEEQREHLTEVTRILQSKLLPMTLHRFLDDPPCNVAGLGAFHIYQELKAVMEAMQTERRKKCSELICLFPLKKIVCNGQKMLTLAEVESFQASGEMPFEREMEVEAALSFIAPIVFGLAAYLDVPLPFPIVYGHYWKCQACQRNISARDPIYRLADTPSHPRPHPSPSPIPPPPAMPSDLPNRMPSNISDDQSTHSHQGDYPFSLSLATRGQVKRSPASHASSRSQSISSSVAQTVTMGVAKVTTEVGQQLRHGRGSLSGVSAMLMARKGGLGRGGHREQRDGGTKGWAVPRVIHRGTGVAHAFTIYDGVCTSDFSAALHLLNQSLLHMCERQGQHPPLRQHDDTLQLLNSIISSPHLGCLVPPRPASALGDLFGHHYGEESFKGYEDGDWIVLSDLVGAVDETSHHRDRDRGGMDEWPSTPSTSEREGRQQHLSPSPANVTCERTPSQYHTPSSGSVGEGNEHQKVAEFHLDG
ncbi:unnamed protein product [Vitrella brassicaformis CCMP3155]|uniref:Uncharacterized protein n=3 Tax=Vitrella brassicaformis TaxID=1169539 RepID=A0A0G4EMR6_VITBC|nr:unnamed protein product [Vitrella brassicaformis CCMP3155]|eukprot:CEL99122.1 unnamed protein product [Vitrella brassicaformis CCMP3155]